MHKGNDDMARMTLPINIHAFKSALLNSVVLATGKHDANIALQDCYYSSLFHAKCNTALQGLTNTHAIQYLLISEHFRQENIL